MNRFIKRVGWLLTWAILVTTSQVHAETTTNSAGGNTTTGNARSLTQGDINQVLANARQAMAQGDLAKAESLLERAEAAKPKYPVLHFGDTPARLRRDLEKLAASRPASARGTSAPEALPQQVTSQSTNPVVNPFTAGVQQMAPPVAAVSNAATVPANVPVPKQISAVELTASIDVAPHVATPTAEDLPATQPASPADPATREICDAEILSARRALIVGDHKQAEQHLSKAQECRITYADHEDSPARVAQSLAELQQLENGKDSSASWKYNYAKFLVGQSEALLAWGDLENAERAASEAAGLTAMIASEDKSPLDLLARINQTRQQKKGAPTGSANNRMMLDQAVAPAAAAVPVDLTLPSFEEQPEVPRIAQLPSISPEPLPATTEVAPAT